MNGMDFLSSPPNCLSTSTEEQSETKEHELEKRDPSDYIFLKLIGKGSFSTVYLAKDIHTSMFYAIKVCEKNHTIREKEILSLLHSKPKPTAPFFVKLYSTFQHNYRLFFVLSYAANGTLIYHINKAESFDISSTKFYAAEILLALEYMHGLGIIHGDLKPENILLDENMHIKITDFGSAKILNAEPLFKQKKKSLMGMAEYISSPLLTDNSEYLRSSDLWALGAIVYHMIVGWPPFRWSSSNSSSDFLTPKKIKNLSYEFPDALSPCTKDLVQKLLVADPSQILGAHDGETYTSIRSHPFFLGVEFETLYQQAPPQIYPPTETSDFRKLRCQYEVSDDFELGLDDRQIMRLLFLDLEETSVPKAPPPSPEPSVKKPTKKSELGLASQTMNKIKASKNQDQKMTRWPLLYDGNLILKHGLVYKGKGLFARKLVLILTLGPHLYFADPAGLLLKGEISWSPELRAKPKNFKTFFVYTPKKRYHFKDPEGYALEWCKAIEEMSFQTYGCGDNEKQEEECRT